MAGRHSTGTPSADDRASSDGRIGWLSAGPLLAALGLSAELGCNAFNWIPPVLLIYTVWATGPLALLLFVCTWSRVPMHRKFSLDAVGLLVATLFLGAATLLLGFSTVDFGLSN